MKAVKAKERVDDVVTEDVLTHAVHLGRRRRSATLHAKNVRYLPEFRALLVSFADESAVMLPIKKYPEFAQLTTEDLHFITLGFGGGALCLASKDLHVSIAGLVSASKPLMDLASTVIAVRNGSSKSDAKILAARENGKKGGRPRKNNSLIVV